MTASCCQKLAHKQVSLLLAHQFSKFHSYEESKMPAGPAVNFILPSFQNRLPLSAKEALRSSYPPNI